MLVFTLISLTNFIVSGALLWSEHHYGEYIVEMGFVWATGLLASVAFIFILNLAFFHVYLYCQGITTYEFIVADSRKVTRLANSITNQI